MSTRFYDQVEQDWLDGFITMEGAKGILGEDSGEWKEFMQSRRDTLAEEGEISTFKLASGNWVLMKLTGDNEIVSEEFPTEIKAIESGYGDYLGYSDAP